MKIFGMLFFTIALMASCDKDNDPSDDNLFVGKYEGSVSYSNSENNTDISTDNGNVTVVKIGDTYKFDFSNAIPSLTDIKMEKNQNTLISDDGTISIDAQNVKIVYTKDGQIWGADCSR